MRYLDFANELVRFPNETTFRTDLATLHVAMHTMIGRLGGDPSVLPDISKVAIVDNDIARLAIENLVDYNLRQYAKGNEDYFADITNQFMLGKLNISIGRYGSTARKIAVDITLVHEDGLENNATFIEMQAALTSEQSHRHHI